MGNTQTPFCHRFRLCWTEIIYWGNKENIRQLSSSLTPFEVFLPMEAFVHKVNVIKCCIVFTFYSLPLFLKFFFFSCGPFLKSLLNLLQYCLCFMFWFFGCDWPRGVQNLSSPTRDWTHTPCIGRQSLNHWTVREIPYSLPFLSRTKIFHVTMKPWISVAVCPLGGLLITFFFEVYGSAFSSLSLPGLLF